jgi:hypothetical protein
MIRHACLGKDILQFLALKYPSLELIIIHFTVLAISVVKDYSKIFFTKIILLNRKTIGLIFQLF